MKGLSWRLIGPHRGGRTVAVAGHPSRAGVFYFGACNGGVWKTEDGARTWRNVSDGFFRSSAVGAVAVAASDPSVVYVGTGEACIRSNVSHGDGVYRSTDGGRTWAHLGLADTRHIARVRVDPRDPDRVYVAALGHAFGPNETRGVFRSRDGGATWEHVLYVDADTGACDLAMDPHNPRILFAGMWHGRRTGHGLTSGSERGGLWRSTDGGDTWTALRGAPGLPDGIWGRIGVSPSGAREGLVYLTLEAEEGGVFRSPDGGDHWEKVNEERGLRQRAWYYEHIFAHPTEPDTVWVMNVEAWRSTDGGRTFVQVPVPHGDNHDLWIDPHDPERMIQGNDGGAIVSYDAGRSWSTPYNQPTAQFYHVTTDRATPYRVYGAQQDNSTLAGPSRTRRAAITMGEWQDIGGGESGHIAVRPDDPDVVYAGSYMYLSRFDRRTGLTRTILPWPDATLGYSAGEVRYRFQWTFPVFVSPHRPSRLYAAANVVFVSDDEGQSWREVSPDLTRNDPEHMVASGGPITRDNTSAEYYCTIFALAESPLIEGRLWAGSDDGRIHIRRGPDATWEEITPPPSLMPQWTLVSTIEPSPFDADTAYVAATRYKLDDDRPFLLRTRDAGATWEAIGSGIPADEATRVVRADPVRRGLLYAGTERGAYVSFDDGGSWQPLGELPVVPVHDLAVHGDDLVAGTHGRAFWILDDIGPLRQWEGPAAGDGAFLFAPRPAERWEPGWSFNAREGRAGYVALDNTMATWERRPGETDQDPPRFLDAGENPRAGVVFTYRLPAGAPEPVTLTIRDAAGEVLRTFSSAEPPKEPVDDADAWRREPRLPAGEGLHRFAWDMRAQGAGHLPKGVYWSGPRRGPYMPPGRYTAELRVGETTLATGCEIVRDPLSTATQADLDARYALAVRVRDAISEAHRAIRTVHRVRVQAKAWEERAKGTTQAEAVAAAVKALDEALTPVEEALTQTKAKHHEDILNFPVRLNDRLGSLLGAIEEGDDRPTDAMHALFGELEAAVETQRDTLARALRERLGALVDAVRSADLPVVAVEEVGTAG